MYPPLELYGSLALLLAAASVLGQGIYAACGRREFSYLAPAVGLAAMVVVEGATIRLPGRWVTSLAVTVLLLAGALVFLRRNRPTLPQSPSLIAAVTLIVVLAASLPFAFGGGFGIFWGKSNDLGYYLYDAQWLVTHAGNEPGQVVTGYPMGPPALAGVLSQATGGISLVATFTAFMIATVVAAAIAALGFFRELATPRRLLAAALVGLPYMTASFYLQSSFKEIALGLYLLVAGLLVAEHAVWGERGEEAGARATLAAVAVITGASLYTYSFAGVYWLVAAGVLLMLGRLVLRGERPAFSLPRPSLPTDRRGRVLLAIGVLVTAAVAIPAWHQISNFVDSRGSLSALNGGKSFGDQPASPWFYTSLGVWPVTDYRVHPPHMFVERLGFLLALAFLARGLLIAWTRRRLGVLAAGGAGIALYLAARWGSGPYVQSKALAIMAPALMLVAVAGALTPLRPGGRRLRGVAATVGAAVFLIAAAASTYLAFAGALVDRGEQGDQLRALGERIQGSSVLFLGDDDYVGWELRGAAALGVSTHDGLLTLLTRPSDQPYWRRFDFDSLAPKALDYTDYVITARGPLMSSPPPNFHVVAQTDSFVLWGRDGPTAPRRTLLEGLLPGAELDCSKIPAPGSDIAGVWARAPVVGDSNHWSATKTPVASGFPYPTALAEGQELSQALELTPGRWEISLQYTSGRSIRVQAPGLDITAPANFQRLGSFWRVGTIDVKRSKPVNLTVSLAANSRLRDLLTGPDALATGAIGLVGSVAATPTENFVGRMPLRDACRRFVDYYLPR